MEKIIFTKKQAVAVLTCIEQQIEIDRFLPVKENDKKYKMSVEELEKKLFEHIRGDQFAGVVEDEVDITNRSKMKM